LTPRLTAPGMLLALLALIVEPGAPARADALVADLTSHLIAITTGFTGASVVLFGATDGPGDVIVVVRGPERDMTVRRKSRVLGIWTNTQSVSFDNVPSFYAVAASRPLDNIVTPSVAGLHRVGLDNLRFEATAKESPQTIEQFSAALIRTQQRAGLFPTEIGKVNFLGERLFRTTIEFPTNVPTGTYLVEVFFARNKDIVTGQTTPLVVSKVGADAEVFAFANRQPGFYGAIAVLMAVVAGWLASLPFRRS
jgi:uncharacterized protein (TIGR02186 family)